MFIVHANIMMEASTLSYNQLDSNASDLMGSAFEAAWEALCSSGERLSAQGACDARIHLARVILDLVQSGERDQRRLRALALGSLDIPYLFASSPCYRQYNLLGVPIGSGILGQLVRSAEPTP